MELHQLVYFEAVARHRHFTRAAAELHVAQPSVSQQIGKLEVELGTPLFHRMKRGVALTEAGRVLLPRVRGALAQLDEARAAVREVGALLSGTLTIGAPPSIGTHLLPRVLATFNVRYPAVTLDLREDGSRALVQHLLEGALDLAVVIEPEGGWKHPALETEPLLEESLLAAVPPGHRLATATSVRLLELKDEPWVMLREGAYELREQTLAACRRAGFEPRIALDGSEMDSVLPFVAAGIGVALLPETVLRSPGGPVPPADSAAGAAGRAGDARGPVGVPVRDAHLARALSVARRKDRHVSGAARIFGGLLRDAYA